MKPVDPHLFVIFGATGDLTRRKLIPALYDLLLSNDEANAAVLGVSRSEITEDDFRDIVRAALVDAGFDEERASSWCDHCVHYEAVPDEDYGTLAAKIADIEEHHHLGGNRVFYLALPPVAFEPVITAIGEHGLCATDGWCRLVVEKPFGHDLASARDLNEAVHRHFSEDQVYRIDHYLGKDTVQNVLVFRFANTVFESLWNRDRIAEVEITVAESLDVANRAGYYDRAGALRDMIQNHITQLLTLIAMEAPSRFTAEAVRNEKVKVLQAIKPLTADGVVYGQYVAGGDVEDYRSHDGVATGSKTPTYVALRLFIDNWRWQGVPFSIRTGKALPKRTTEVTVTFRKPPVTFFADMEGAPSMAQDTLVLTLQPDEGFDLCIDVKRPGEGMQIEKIPLSFEYASRFGDVTGAYATLLADIVEGDQTLFVRADEVEEAWEVYQPILEAEIDPHDYRAGTWGPEAAGRLAPGGWKTGATDP